MRGAGQRLATLRLELRPPAPADAPALAAAIGNYDVARWLGAVPFPYTEDDAAKFIAKAQGQRGRAWLVFEDQALVGGAGLGAELGYWLARPAWGRGLATELGDALVDLHFGRQRGAPLYAGHYLGNDRSARVLDKLGFRPETVVARAARVLGQEVDSRRMILDPAEWVRRRRYRLTTPRLVLRGLEPGDAGAVLRLMRGDAASARLAPLPAPATRAEAARWIDAVRYRGRPAFSAAIVGRFGRLIGVVGLVRTGDGTLELGLALAPEHRGRGLATEAASAFLADARRRFGLSQVAARALPAAAEGACLLSRLGFVAAAPLEAAPAMHYRLTLDG